MSITEYFLMCNIKYFIVLLGFVEWGVAGKGFSSPRFWVTAA